MARREATEADWKRRANRWDAELGDFRAFLLPVFRRHGFSDDAALLAYYHVGTPPEMIDEDDETEEYE